MELTMGRPLGAKNKRTLAREAANKEVMDALREEFGDQVFEGDGVAFLQTIYKNPKMPIEMRVDCAKNAARFERPALSSVDSTIDDKRQSVAWLPKPAATVQEWQQDYGDLSGDAQQKH
jgi:hypothetical protein